MRLSYRSGPFVKLNVPVPYDPGAVQPLILEVEGIPIANLLHHRRDEDVAESNDRDVRHLLLARHGAIDPLTVAAVDDLQP